MPAETHNGILKTMSRLPSSRNGNPRWQLCLWRDDREVIHFRTRPDCSLGYSVANFLGWRVNISLVTYRGHASLSSINHE